MVVRIGCMYSDDWDFNTYGEGERIEIGRDAISANCAMANPGIKFILNGMSLS